MNSREYFAWKLENKKIINIFFIDISALLYYTFPTLVWYFEDTANLESKIGISMYPNDNIKYIVLGIVTLSLCSHIKCSSVLVHKYPNHFHCSVDRFFSESNSSQNVKWRFRNVCSHVNLSRHSVTDNWYQECIQMIRNNCAHCAHNSKKRISCCGWGVVRMTHVIAHSPYESPHVRDDRERCTLGPLLLLLMMMEPNGHSRLR